MSNYTEVYLCICYECNERMRMHTGTVQVVTIFSENARQPPLNLLKQVQLLTEAVYLSDIFSLMVESTSKAR